MYLHGKCTVYLRVLNYDYYHCLLFFVLLLLLKQGSWVVDIQCFNESPGLFIFISILYINQSIFFKTHNMINKTS